MDPCADFPEETALVVEPIQSSWGIKKSEGQNEPSMLPWLENVDVFFRTHVEIRLGNGEKGNR